MSCDKVSFTQWLRYLYYITGVYNEGYMKLVDSALFALILDDHTPSCPNEMTRTFLHGDAANR